MVQLSGAEPYLADDFCVIAAVNDHGILDECLARSPDVVSGQLPLTIIEGAADMAEAYNAGLARTAARICVFAHQDVYLPVGWLDRAIDVLNGLLGEAPDWMVAGPYGVQSSGAHVGRVWDVTMDRELGESGFPPTPVVSFDELLLILRRDAGFQFDASLPSFHLYGTDVAQAARASMRSAWAVELPVVHNNRPIVSLAGGYLDAYRYMRTKWRDELPIPTTICALSRNPFPLWRARWRRRRVKQRGDSLQAEAREVAKRAGYE